MLAATDVQFPLNSRLCVLPFDHLGADARATFVGRADAPFPFPHFEFADIRR